MSKAWTRVVPFFALAAVLTWEAPSWAAETATTQIETVLFTGGAEDPLSEIDKVLKRFDSYENFVKDPAAVKSVAEQLEKYFRGGSSQGSVPGFTSMMRGLEEVAREYPELAPELLKPSGEVELKVEVPLRAINREKVNMYKAAYAVMDHLKTVGPAPEPVHNMMSDSYKKKNAKVVQDRWDYLSQRLAQILADSSLSEKQRQQQLGQVYAQTLDKDFNQALKNLLFVGLQTNGDILNLPTNPDLFFARVESALQDKVITILKQSGFDNPQLVRKAMTLLPDRKQLLARTDIFPLATEVSQRGAVVDKAGMMPGSYRLRPYPAKFIALIKCSASECVGSHATRRLIPLLPGVETLSLEYGNKNQGYIQEVPWQHRENGKQVYSSEIYTQNGVFFRGFVKDRATLESTSLVNEWVKFIHPDRVRVTSPGNDATGASFQPIDGVAGGKYDHMKRVEIGQNVEFQLAVSGLQTIEERMIQQGKISTYHGQHNYGPGFVTPFRNGHLNVMGLNSTRTGHGDLAASTAVFQIVHQYPAPRCKMIFGNL